MRRVAFVLPDFHGGGAQQVMIALARGLDRDAFDPALVVVNGTGPWVDRVGDLPVSDLCRPHLRSALPALGRVLRRQKPDIVVSTMGYLNLGVLLLAPWLGPARLVVREANTPRAMADGVLGRFAVASAYRALYRRARRVLSPSRRLAEELVADFGVPKPLVQIVRNPVNETALRSTRPRRPTEPGQQFVAVGRLTRQKGYDRLLETVARSAVRAHIRILGEGPERRRLADLSRSLGLEDLVTFAGFDPNPAPWVAGADALLLPSRWEGLPNAALEALACGTPVIATPEAGAIDEIADLAPRGAVTLATMGDAFASAMNRVPPKLEGETRPSLLPSDFSAEAVDSTFKDVLESCT